MQSFNWAPEHSGALRDCLSRGMSYLEAAEALNARFGTRFTRDAVAGRAQRLGLKAAPRSRVSKRPFEPKQEPRQRETAADMPTTPEPVPKRAEPVKLRCVGIKPRLLAFADLGPGDCRYPYGGDKEGEAIAFCAHPKLANSSYCAPHHHLTRRLGSASGRVSEPVMLRLVRAA